LLSGGIKNKTESVMEFAFSYGHERGFNPKYAGIDWHAIWHADKAADSGVLFSTYNEEGEESVIELTQDNCFIYLNATNPEFDVIVIETCEDEEEHFWMSRGQIGNDNFNELVFEIGEEGRLTHTRYPIEHCVDFVMSILVDDIQQVKGPVDIPIIE
jgi:hypothetical protein